MRCTPLGKLGKSLLGKLIGSDKSCCCCGSSIVSVKKIKVDDKDMEIAGLEEEFEKYLAAGPWFSGEGLDHHRDGRGNGRPPPSTGVITSYSIHYTKLYDLFDTYYRRPAATAAFIASNQFSKQTFS